ncbi:MFS transporter [Sulfolobus tengchongensis]|uniref:MFS transporter n=1 Tax=Sulfolobus tengchongensis TaxID=207809 RepID=A0AAX4L433_9CREN
MVKYSVVKTSMAGLIGTMVEFYDFFLAGATAITIWPTLFFPSSIPALALALSITAYAISYIGRPVGALIFGHFGDSRGRLSALIWTLLIASIGTIGVALVPSYASIGIIAPALIILFRILFGVGIGGELGGAATWISEVGNQSKLRALWSGGFVQLGGSLGIALSTGLFTLTANILPSSALISWGWRLLFGIGAVLLILGAIMRYKLSESPLFLQEKDRIKQRKGSPAIMALKSKWKTILLLALIAMYVPITLAGVIQSFLPSYFRALELQHGVHVPPSLITEIILIGSVSGGIIGPVVGGVLSNILGRKKTIMISTLGTAILLYIALLIYSTRAFPAIVTMESIVYLIALIGNAALTNLFVEYFPTEIRYSASSLVYQIGNGIYGGVTISFIYTSLVASLGGIINAISPIVFATSGIAIISFIVTLLSRETKDLDLAKVST